MWVAVRVKLGKLSLYVLLLLVQLVVVPVEHSVVVDEDSPREVREWA